MSNFTNTLQAYQAARERASVASAIEASTLHTAIHDGREEGMSVREVATALNLPKSTIARHWLPGHPCSTTWPMWGSHQAWQEAHAAVWAHDPNTLADDHVPYEWTDDGQHRTIRVRFLPGHARLSQQ